MIKLRRILYIVPAFMTLAANATPLDADVAIANARANCATISQSFGSMKTMAQINTAVTATGTAAGAGATIAGIAKADIDKRLEKLIRDVKQRESQSGATAMTLDQSQDFIDETLQLVYSKTQSTPEKSELEQQSKNLGNWRTGLLAANTATNIAATVIAATNHTSDDLRTQLNKCVESIRDLQDSWMQARIENADPAVLDRMDRIITACRGYENLDISKIDTKARNATAASGIGAVVGATGTITSAMANSDKVRNDDSDSGMAKEKNLNNASNVLAAGATVASGVATVFNAQQIGTLNRAQNIAKQCSEALNQ